MSASCDAMNCWIASAVLPLVAVPEVESVLEEPVESADVRALNGSLEDVLESLLLASLEPDIMARSACIMACCAARSAA